MTGKSSSSKKPKVEKPLTETEKLLVEIRGLSRVLANDVGALQRELQGATDKRVTAENSLTALESAVQKALEHAEKAYEIWPDMSGSTEIERLMVCLDVGLHGSLKMKPRDSGEVAAGGGDG